MPVGLTVVVLILPSSGNGVFNHSRYPASRGRGSKMSSVSFNRKRVKLKQLLGIRARLALLAVILVAPLMLERARSLEDNRARQLAQASQDFANLARHSADTQREVISSVADRAEIRGLYPRLRRRLDAHLRYPARQRAGQHALDPQHPAGRRRRPRAVLDRQYLCRPLSRRPALSQEGAGDARLRRQRLPDGARRQQSGRDGRLSGLGDQSGFGCRRCSPA